MPIVLLLLWWILILPQASAESAWPQSRPLVAELQLDGQPFLDTLFLHETDEHLLLPLGELARLFGIGVTVDVDGRGAAGFIVDERVRFLLKLDTRTVQWASHSESFAPQLVRWIDDDLHVELQLLQRWWPIDLSFDRRSLVLQARPRQKLPIQLRSERELAASRLSMRESVSTRETFPLIDTPPEWWSVPTIDNVVSVALRRDRGDTAVTTAYSATFAGDFFAMEAQAQMNLRVRRGRGDQPQSKDRHLRLILARHDAEGQLLGRLNATSVQLGQVDLPVIKALPLERAMGWGAMISNQPLERPSRYGLHTLRGWLPEGWDVTLFVNDRLAGFAVSSAAQRYEFADQPLFFGRNEFRLQFNGPQGQQRVETEVYWLDQSVTEPGAAYYTFGIHRDDEGRVNSLLQGDLGVARGLAISAAVLHTQEPRRAVSGSRGQVGIRGSLLRSRVDLDHGRGANGERTTDLALTTRIGGVSIHALSSWREASGDLVAGRREEWRIASGPYTVTLLRDGVRQTKSQVIEPRVYLNLAGLNISQALRFRKAEDSRYIFGASQLVWHAAHWVLTGQLDYRLHPQAQLEGVTARLARNFDSGHRVTLGVTRAAEPRSAALTLAWSRTFRAFGLGLNLRLSESGGVEAALQWLSSLALEPQGRRMLSDAYPLAMTGAVIAKVFLDENANGRFDANERAIEAASFRVNGGSRLEPRTNALGEALLARLTANSPTELEIDPTSLEDAQWQSSRPGIRLVPRAGRVQQVDFPIVATSEIEGFVIRRGAELSRPMGAIRVQLINEREQIEREVRTSGDGYFVIGEVRPGRYRVRPDPEQLAKLGFVVQREIEIATTQQGGELHAVELIVTRSAGT